MAYRKLKGSYKHGSIDSDVLEGTYLHVDTVTGTLKLGNDTAGGTTISAGGSTGDLTITGSSIIAPSNADLTLQVAGSGNITMQGITIDDNELYTSASNENLMFNTSGTGMIQFYSAYTFPRSDGSPNQVLQTDGSGALSFGSVSVGDFTFTGSTIISPSNADITLDPQGTGGIALNANTTIVGNLNVTGTQTTLETTTLVVEDPLLELAKNNSGGIANSMDQGLFFNRGSLTNVSFLWDESADEFVVANTSGEDGTTSGNVTIDSYANFHAGDLQLLGMTLADNKISAARSNDDLILSAAGTGNIILGALTINGTTLSSTDSSSININEGLIVDGTASVLSTLTTPTIATNNIGASDSSSVAFTSPVEFQGAVQGITSLKAAGLTYPTSDGSPGQFLKTDGSGTLSFASVSIGDLSIIGATIAAPSNAPLTLVSSGSSVDIEGLSVAGNVISTTDSSAGVEITGNLIPSADGIYQLGSASRRWQILYVSAETIDVGGATISSDGTGAIEIAATGATLPASSKVGTRVISLNGSTAGTQARPVQEVPLYVQDGSGNVDVSGSAALTFEFNGTVEDIPVFTEAGQTFILSTGATYASSDLGITQFQF